MEKREWYQTKKGNSKKKKRKERKGEEWRAEKLNKVVMDWYKWNA